MQDVGWYYAVNGQRQGPIPFEQLQQMTMTGQIAAADLVWREGMNDWQPVHTIPALLPPPPQPSYPQPPQYQQGYAPQGYAPMPVGYQTPMTGGKSYQGMAIAGFVLSLLVIFPCTILGLIFSLIALNGMKTTPNQDGKGLAIAGTIISIIFLSMACLYFVGIASCMSRF